MRKIIDIHAHLGDIFHYQKNVIWKQGVEPGDYPNPFKRLEESGFNAPLLHNTAELPTLFEAAKKLNWENTLENLTKRLDKDNITFIVLYPILPNTGFEEYLAASRAEPRILLFTSADFTLPIPEMKAKLEQNIAFGAKGIKIHNVLQDISMDDPRLHAAVEVFGIRKMPIVFHCGINDYYPPEQKDFIRTPEYADLKYFLKLADEYPEFIFIAGHAGGLNGGEMEMLAEHWESMKNKNVYVDTSFRSVDNIKKLVEFFGEDKVCYGTDLPFSGHTITIKLVEEAFPNDPEIREKIFYKNAARILKINM
jgi:predicted TIM-barrel fold metal-dependent hydrolase